MKPLIIPFFLRNGGCRNRCVFCSERMIAGNAEAVTETVIRETVEACVKSSKRRTRRQIAFYGGSFTGMTREAQMQLLRPAGELIREGAVQSIRISARPDDIDAHWLDTLKTMGVTSVEIGAQSMDDGVLSESSRGHTATDVRKAVAMLKDKGFETGVHLMAGLPGDDRGKFLSSVADVIALGPDTVRIHPVLVFRGTELARRHDRGEYRPLTIDEAVLWCKAALVQFTRAGIPVIRLGLQATGEMEQDGNIAAGPWHPSFRSLVESALFMEMALDLIARAEGIADGQVFRVAPADVSSFNGAGGSNLARMEARFGRSVTARKDALLKRGSLVLGSGLQEYATSIAEVRVV